MRSYARNPAKIFTTKTQIIRHTADENEPDENSDEYISPVPVSGDVTIRAKEGHLSFSHFMDQFIAA